MNYLLDTNVVSEWVKPSPDPSVTQWLAEADEDRVYLSVVTLGEITRGVEELPRSPRQDRLKAWLDNDLTLRFEQRLLGVNAPVARSWGEIMARAQRKGHAANPVDALFAATALVYDLTLVTRNMRDFQPLEVALFNPWTSSVR